MECWLTSADNFRRDKRIRNSLVKEYPLLKLRSALWSVYMHNVYNMSLRKWRMIHRRWLNVHRREFPFSHPIHPSFLLMYISSSQSGEGSLISPLEASIQRLVRLSTDITNFTFHPFSASNEATTASRRVPHSSSLPDLLRYYPVFFPAEKTSHSILSGFASNRTRLFARYSRIVIRWWSSRAGWVSQNYLKHRSSGGRIYVRSLWLLQTSSN